ncbi:cytochrome c oxidase assembly protein [Amphritea balenae]|uniref:Cytochrome c oxidase assembly protein CtaG n=1 Tax=Amphritea balenae TaxID=452629 RepID=A0A3P1SL13_9GAMM|nr:cytochrome c oxidase assembly protein [Amphritea balenae]RRC96992.1 cytochrome c oxidase assembly protein [Amphritea balenae]GGK85014.1 cytochrome c oxidase assembly protein [Amphritea balenae]
MSQQQQPNRTLIIRLIAGAVLMFGFGFLLVPLYDVFCQVTGLNGKVLNTGPVQDVNADPQRRVRVQFIAVNNESMPWRFRPEQSQLTVYPGQMKQTAFIAMNPTSSTMIGQAVPSVAPSEAAEFLHKVNCFCFEQQPLDAGEQRAMPLVFVIDAALPEHIKTVTLSYTLFDITPDTGPVAAVTEEPERRNL